ncbi:unnamed protein product, partial [marine sediment metagenome]
IGGAIILSVIYIIFSPPLYTSSSSFMIGRLESLFADRYLRISMEEEITNHLYLIKTGPVVQKAAYAFTPEEIEKMEFDSATQVLSRIKSDLNSGRINIGVEGESRIIKNIDDDRIRYLRHERNKGGSAARNTGIMKARGKYIALFDSDDVWVKEKLERQIDVIENSKLYPGVVYFL